MNGVADSADGSRFFHPVSVLPEIISESQMQASPVTE